MQADCRPIRACGKDLPQRQETGESKVGEEEEDDEEVDEGRVRTSEETRREE